MAWKRLTDRLKSLSLASLAERPGKRPVGARGPGKNESGIALFMVLSTVTVLAVVVTEFTYVAQVNARLAFDSSDQLKAHYMALTGLKVSLLRLKAYSNLKSLGKGGGAQGGIAGAAAAAGVQLPRALLDQIWRIPFSYPIPKDAPGLNVIAREEIEKFTTESGLQGSFTAIIESESNRMNLNSILPAYAAAIPSPTTSPGAGAGAGGGNAEDGSGRQNPNTNQKTGPKYDPKEAREGMKTFIANIINQKFKDDQDFAREYRDFQIDELMDNILGWVDPTYTPKNASGRQTIPYKRAPFYSISELKLIYPIDDGLYDLLAPQFTTMPTSGVNVNTMERPLLRAFFPNATDEEVDEFYKFRDSEEADNSFKDEKAFWDYIGKAFGSVGSRGEELRQKFLTQGVVFIVDEETFKITVIGKENKAQRLIEAWVSIAKADSGSGNSRQRRGNQNGANPPAGPNGEPVDDTGVNPDAVNQPGANGGNNAASTIGLKIIFMRES